jgi:hypothetical protein
MHSSGKFRLLGIVNAQHREAKDVQSRLGCKAIPESWLKSNRMERAHLGRPTLTVAKVSKESWRVRGPHDSVAPSKMKGVTIKPLEVEVHK